MFKTNFEYIDLEKERNRRSILMTEHDFQDIQYAMVEYCSDCSIRDMFLAEELLDDLDQARLISCLHTPPDLVTLHSQVEVFDVQNCKTHLFTLVLPEEEDAERKYLSILSPLGRRLMGAKVNDIIEFTYFTRKNQYRVKKIIYQPESAGDYQKKIPIHPKTVEPQRYPVPCRQSQLQ